MIEIIWWLSCVLMWWRQHGESFENSVAFLSAQDTREFIRKDSDGYVSGMSHVDLHARAAVSKEAYLERASKAAIDFSAPERSLLVRLSREVDRMLWRRADSLEQRIGVDVNTLVRLPWTFALTRASAYENGLPHTRADIIFVSTALFQKSESNIMRMLLHEKIHVYQRLNPSFVQASLKRLGFKKWKRLRSLGNPRLRANPDVDGWAYLSPWTGSPPMIPLYASLKPRHVSDAHGSFSTSHPYEWMAYAAEEELH